VNTTYDSPFGIIRSNWKKTGNSVMFEITVPPNTSATFVVPVLKPGTVTIQDLSNEKKISKQVSKSDSELALESGSYIIVY
jgi:alpha-L-rhamnosidase